MITDQNENGYQQKTVSKKDGAPWNWQEHLPLLITAFSIFFIILRLLSISGYNGETADGILQASGTATVIIGALIPAIGQVTFPLGVFFGFIARANKSGGLPRPFVALMSLFLLVAGLILTPVSIIILGVVAFTFGFATRGLTNRINASQKLPFHHRKSASKDNFFYILAVYLIAITLATFSNPLPWVPAEKIVPMKGRSFTGYVLDETETNVSILEAKNRTLVYMMPNEIVARTVCRPSNTVIGPFFTGTLFTLAFRPASASYPQCP